MKISIFLRTTPMQIKIARLSLGMFSNSLPCLIISKTNFFLVPLFLLSVILTHPTPSPLPVLLPIFKFYQSQCCTRIIPLGFRLRLMTLKNTASTFSCSNFFKIKLAAFGCSRYNFCDFISCFCLYCDAANLQSFKD